MIHLNLICLLSNYLYQSKMANENLMTKSWKDSNWIPQLSPHNVLAYFCQRSNLFYDKTCNNEIAKMQRLNPGQLLHMKGLWFLSLLH